MQTYEITPNIDTVADLLTKTSFTVNDVIPQYIDIGPVCDLLDVGYLEVLQDHVSIPVYGRTEFDRSLNQEIYPIVATKTEDPFTITMPPLAQQWRQDWQKRVNRAWRRGAPFWQPCMRAPKQFIETGVWPKDEPRPMTPDFYSKNKELS